MTDTADMNPMKQERLLTEPLPTGGLHIVVPGGVAFAALWVVFCAAYALHIVGIDTFRHLMPHQLLEFLAVTMSVPILLWISIGHWQRLNALKQVTASLQRHLSMLACSGTATEDKVSSVSESLTRQAEILACSSRFAISSLRNVADALTDGARTLDDISSGTIERLGVVGSGLSERLETLEKLNAAVGSITNHTDERLAASTVSLSALLEKIDNSGTRLDEKAALLAENGLGLAENIAEVTGRIDHSIERLSQVQDRFDQRRGEVELSETRMSRDLAHLGEVLSEKLGALRDEGQVLVTDFYKSAESLFTRMHEFTREGDRIISQTGELHRLASDQIQHFDRVADDLERRSGAIRSGLETGREDAEAIGRDIGRQFDDISHRVRNHIAEIGEHTFGRLSEIGDRFAENRSSFESVFASATRRFDDMAGRLDGQIVIVDNAGRAINEGLRGVETVLQSTIAGQKSVTEEFSSLDARAEAFGRRMDELRHAVGESAHHLSHQTEQLRVQAETVTQELDGQTGRMTERAGEIDSLLRGAGETAGTIVRTLEDTTRRAGENIATIDRELQDALVQVDKRLVAVDDKTLEIRHSVSSSVDRLDSLTQELDSIRQKTVTHVDHIHARVEDIATGFDRSVGRIEEASSGIMIVANDMNLASSNLTGASETLREAGGEIVRSVDETGMTLGAAALSLTGTVGDLSAIARRTGEEIGRVVEQVRHEGTVISGFAVHAAQIGKDLRSTSAAMEAAVNRSDALSEGVRAKFIHVGHEISQQGAEFAERLASTNLGLEQTKNAMQLVAENVDSTFGNLSRKAGEINFIVSTSVNRLNELRSNLEQAQQTIDASSTAIGDRLAQTTQTITNGLAGVHEAASHTLDRLERTVSSLSTGHDFHGIMDATLTKIHMVEASFLEKQKTLTGALEQVTSHFSRMSDDLARSSAQLGETAAVSATSLSDASSRIEDKIRIIRGVSTGADNTLQAFQATLGGIHDRTAMVTQQVATQGETLRQALAGVTQAAGNATQTLQTASDIAHSRIASFSDLARQSGSDIAAIVVQLQEEGRVILETGAQSRDLAREVATLLGEKAAELVDAVHVAATETVTLREADFRNRRNLFLGSAASILEELQSLSIDISKVLDKDVPEKSWRSSHRNDGASLTRRLVFMRDHVPVENLRTRFSSDHQFRISTQRYLRQFEELLEQAAAADPSDILSSTLMSSDIGKIYYFLAGAIGRDRELQKAV